MAPRDRDAVDYIVIGAGSAGCVIANRLRADPQRSVLLLEAGGPDDHLFLRMPLAFLKAMFKPQFVWNYMSEPEPHLNGRQLWLPRGRLYGIEGLHAADASIMPTVPGGNTNAASIMVGDKASDLILAGERV